MSRLLVSALLLVALIGCTQGASILWTGYVGDNQWTTQNNWYPNSVPGPNDDVTIAKGTVILTIPTGVNSLTMGTDVDTPGNLTLFHAFAVGSGGMSIKANGNLIQDTGLETVTGNVNIDGTWTFKSGSASGSWTISAKGSAFFPGAGQRNIVAGAVVNQGNLWVSGVVGLNMSAVLKNAGNMQGSGELQFMVFDSSNANFNSATGSLTFAGSVMRFQAPSVLGAVTLTSGNVECYNAVSFGKDLVIPSGSTVSSLGNANVSFGGAVSGAGSLVASGKLTTIGNLNIASATAAGGYTSFTAGASAGQFTVSGGNVNFGGDVQGANVDLKGGILFGKGSITATTTASVATQGCNIATTVAIAGKGAVTANSLLTFDKAGSFVVTSTGSLSVDKQFNITGPSGSGGFQNSGSVSVGGWFQSQNIDISGNGSFAVTGTMSTSTCKFGASTVSISGKGSVSGSNTALKIGSVNSGTTGKVTVTVGDYSLSCPVHCDAVSSPSSPDAYSFGASA